MSCRPYLPACAGVIRPLHGLLLFSSFFVVVLSAVAPNDALACACGCGVFEVGTAAMFPTGTGGLAYFEYDYMDQDRNWSGTRRAPAADNPDKDISTDFMTLGADYMFNHRWGVEVQLPYWERHYKTTDETTGNLVSFHHGAVGDIRLMGVYTGLSDDMSTGLQFGLKLPSGDYTYPHFDRDTEIGTGSTDVLVGAYHMGALTANGAFNWFAQALLDVPTVGSDHYLPGDELDGSVGIYYNGWSVGNNAQLSPILQVVGSHRARDSGANADPVNTGYDRLLISPGLEFDVGNVKFNVDISVPVFQRMTGNQLTAPELFQFVVGYAF